MTYSEHELEFTFAKNCSVMCAKSARKTVDTVLSYIFANTTTDQPKLETVNDL